MSTDEMWKRLRKQMKAERELENDSTWDDLLAQAKEYEDEANRSPTAIFNGFLTGALVGAILWVLAYLVAIYLWKYGVLR